MSEEPSLQEFETEPCDKCGDEIVHSVHQPRYRMGFRDPDTDGDVCNFVSFALCPKCEAQIVDWIRGDETADRGVNTIGMAVMAEHMDQTAEELAALANRFRDRLHSEMEDNNE